MSLWLIRSFLFALKNAVVADTEVEDKEEGKKMTSHGVVDIEDTIGNKEHEENMINKALDKKKWVYVLKVEN